MCNSLSGASFADAGSLYLASSYEQFLSRAGYILLPHLQCLEGAIGPGVGWRVQGARGMRARLAYGCYSTPPYYLGLYDI